jgi:site-specific DNA recombinase
MKPAVTLRVGLYARVSSDRQAEERTIDSQIAALRERIQADGVQVDGELQFVDDGYSGGTLLRPALERLRDQVAQGALDRLYVHSPDRLARNYAYQFVLLEEFGRAGLEVVFLNHALGQSPEGDLLLQVQGVIAEYERAKIRERIRRGKLHAARSGKVSVLGRAPYGYRYIRKQEGGDQARFEIVAHQARVVQQMFVWVARERLTLREVCRRLEKLGEPSPRGQARWVNTTVASILNNPAYHGQAAFRKRQVVPRQPRLRPVRGKAEVPRRPCSVVRCSEPIMVPVPALVSVEDFAAVAEQRAENRRRVRQQRAGARHLLQGLVVCRDCGYAFVGSTNRARPKVYHYYRCSSFQAAGAQARCPVGTVHAEPLEVAVWQDVCALLRQPQKIEEEYQRRLEDSPGANTSRGIEPLTRVMEKVKRTIARLIDLYSEGLLERSELEPRLQSAKQRLRKLEEQAQGEAAQLAERAELRLALTHLQEFAAQVEQGLDRADWATRRQVIRALVKRIEIGPDAVRIVYRVAPVPFVERPHDGGVLQDCTNRCKSLQPLHALHGIASQWGVRETMQRATTPLL